MPGEKSLFFKLTVALGGIIIGLGIPAFFGFNPQVYAEEPKISAEAIETLSKTGRAMAEVVAAVKPAVVNISSTLTGDSQIPRFPAKGCKRVR